MIAEDYRSATWRRLREELTTRLDDLRRQNDSPTHTAEQTALIRGQIREVKRILSLGVEPSESPEDDPLA